MDCRVLGTLHRNGDDKRGGSSVREVQLGVDLVRHLSYRARVKEEFLKPLRAWKSLREENVGNK